MLKRIGVSLILIAILLPSAVGLFYFRYVNWRPLDHPLRSISGEVTERFFVNYSSPYGASLAFDNHAMSSERLQCLLGITGFSPAPDCKGQEPILRFQWKLLQDGAVLDSGRYSGRGTLSLDDTYADFGGFSAGRGEYSVTLKFDEGAESLEVANPRLVVFASPRRFEDAYVITAASVCAGIIIGLSGLVLLYWDRLRVRRSIRLAIPNS